jgi:SCY1-like protein 2
MEFATSLLSSASTALAAAQKPTLSSTYTTDPSISPIQIGVWKITRAKHNSNNKQVSIWNCDKGSLSSNSGLSGGSSSSRRDRDRDGDRLKYAIDTLKKEASSLSRLRHPCILEMAEPPAETRSSITFATEPVLSSLQHSLNVSTRRNKSREEEELELDEVEIQKGMSQLGKGLQFLHESAKLVHCNLTPEAVIINAKVRSVSTLLFLSAADRAACMIREIGNYQDSDCQPTFSIPRESERSGISQCMIQVYLVLSRETMITSVCQFFAPLIYFEALWLTSLEPMDSAPEYILDESAPAPANDLYSLGCILHAIHLRTGPPFANHNTLSTARSNIESSLSLLTSQWRKLPQETQQVLNSLITRYPNRRMSAKQFLESSYFEGVLVGTLRFLERDSFNSKPGDVQASFLKGLITVSYSCTDSFRNSADISVGRNILTRSSLRSPRKSID